MSSRFSIICTCIIAFVAGGCTPMSHADTWQLVNERSSLSFVTIKAGDIGESHRFEKLTGSAADNTVSLTIELASVETAIPIRNDRMREFLFETELFPAASFSGSVELAQVEALAAGESLMLPLTGDFKIKDRSVNLSTTVMVTRVAGDSVLVTSQKPVVLNAGALGLEGGVEKLRELAGLPSISQAVPVSFALTFSR